MAAISKPLWFLLPIPPGDERYPNLDVIIPETGFIVNLTPLTFDALVTFVAGFEAANFASLALFAFAILISSSFFAALSLLDTVLCAFLVSTDAILL